MNFFKSLVVNAYIKATEEKWNIGFIDDSLDNILKGAPISIDVVKHNYNEGWFADPFILSVDEKYIWLLVEELYYPTGKGRISKLTIQRDNNKLIKVEPILQLTSHLSFPAIKSRQGNLISIYPENGKGQGLVLYNYNLLDNKCEFVRVVSNKPLADAIITDVFGECKLFATEIPTHNGNILSEYNCKDNMDLELLNEIVFPSNVARNAGDWFKYKEKIYRPAQDCNNCYGEAVILQEVSKENGKLTFRDVRRIVSTDRRYTTGCHTFNIYNGMIVVDVHGYVHPFLSRCFIVFLNLYRIIKKSLIINSII